MDFMKKITDITQKVGETAVDTYKTVANKSGEFIKDTKLKMSISEKESEMNEIYENIGKTVYDMYTKKEDVGEVFLKECKKVDKIQKEISEINNTLLYNKDLRKCSSCLEVIDIDSKFCPICGQKQETIKQKKEDTKKIEEEKEEIYVCPQCGNKDVEKGKFCSKCGYKL